MPLKRPEEDAPHAHDKFLDALYERRFVPGLIGFVVADRTAALEGSLRSRGFNDPEVEKLVESAEQEINEGAVRGLIRDGIVIPPDDPEFVSIREQTEKAYAGSLTEESRHRLGAIGLL